MAETITPVVYGGRRTRWMPSVALHVLGAGLAAAALGGALGAVGLLLGAPWGPAGLWTVAAVAALYSARELLRVPVPLPDRKKQVPEWWRTYFGPRTAAFLYGLGLGVGFFTHLRHGTLVAVGALALVSGEPAVGALMLAPFGVARGLTVLVAASATSDGRLGRLMGRLDSLATSAAPRMVNGTVLVALGVGAAAWAPAATFDRGGSLAAEALAVVFAWAAVAKMVRFGRWKGSLAAYELPAEGGLAVAVPALEAVVPALVLAGRPELAGALSLVLLAGFSAAIVRARRLAGDRLPCGCFGRSARRDYRLLLGRNAALAAVAVMATFDTVALPGVDRPGAVDVLPVLLVAAGAALAALLVREARRTAHATHRPPS